MTDPLDKTDCLSYVDVKMSHPLALMTGVVN